MWTASTRRPRKASVPERLVEESVTDRVVGAKGGRVDCGCWAIAEIGASSAVAMNKSSLVLGTSDLSVTGDSTRFTRAARSQRVVVARQVPQSLEGSRTDALASSHP